MRSTLRGREKERSRAAPGSARAKQVKCGIRLGRVDCGAQTRATSRAQPLVRAGQASSSPDKAQDPGLHHDLDD